MMGRRDLLDDEDRVLLTILHERAVARVLTREQPERVTGDGLFTLPLLSHVPSLVLILALAYGEEEHD